MRVLLPALLGMAFFTAAPAVAETRGLRFVGDLAGDGDLGGKHLDLFVSYELVKTPDETFHGDGYNVGYYYRPKPLTIKGKLGDKPVELTKFFIFVMDMLQKPDRDRVTFYGFYGSWLVNLDLQAAGFTTFKGLAFPTSLNCYSAKASFSAVTAGALAAGKMKLYTLQKGSPFRWQETGCRRLPTGVPDPFGQ